MPVNKVELINDDTTPEYTSLITPHTDGMQTEDLKHIEDSYLALSFASHFKALQHFPEDMTQIFDDEIHLIAV